MPYTAPFIAKNCGFLFTAGGRTAFLIFLGAVCFGLLPAGAGVNTYNIGYNMSLGAGIATFCNAFFNCFIICKCVGPPGRKGRGACGALSHALPTHTPTPPRAPTARAQPPRVPGDQCCSLCARGQ